MEGEVIVTQELFKFEYLDETAGREDRRRISLDGPAPLHARKGQAVRLRPAVSGVVSLTSFPAREGTWTRVAPPHAPRRILAQHSMTAGRTRPASAVASGSGRSHTSIHVN